MEYSLTAVQYVGYGILQSEAKCQLLVAFHIIIAFTNSITYAKITRKYFCPEICLEIAINTCHVIGLISDDACPKKL